MFWCVEDDECADDGRSLRSMVDIGMSCCSVVARLDRNLECEELDVVVDVELVGNVCSLRKKGGVGSRLS
jgi:hypothetical protein